MNRSPSLEDVFERYESLPSGDAEDAKRDVVDRILAGIAQRLARVDARDERYRAVRDRAARVRLLAPGAEGFDDAVLHLIDAARELLGDAPLADAEPVRAVAAAEDAEPADRAVTEASEASFPASDPPGYVAGGDGAR